jgi:hypothetical protein
MDLYAKKMIFEKNFQVKILKSKKKDFYED